MQFKEKLAELESRRVPAVLLSGQKERHKIKLRSADFLMVCEVRDRQLIVERIAAIGQRERNAAYRAAENNPHTRQQAGQKSRPVAETDDGKIITLPVGHGYPHPHRRNWQRYDLSNLRSTKTSISAGFIVFGNDQMSHGKSSFIGKIVRG